MFEDAGPFVWVAPVRGAGMCSSMGLGADPERWTWCGGGSG